MVLDELVTLIRSRYEFPNKNGFTSVGTSLDSNILFKNLSGLIFDEKRVDAIRKALKGESSEIEIKYIVPWDDNNNLVQSSVDLILSNAVLEHVNDIASVYRDLYLWLKPGGFMSHEIFFTCHEISKKWNGHWGCSDRLWDVLKRNKPYFINRLPHSIHISELVKNGFEIVTDIIQKRTDGINREKLSSQWKNLSDEDLNCCSALIIAKK